MSLLFDLFEQKKTEELAANFATIIQAPLVIGFYGEIGAGKTTFIRAMLRALGVRGAIKSPTYSLIESYLVKDLLLHHFDLYRIHDETELEYIGFRDYFSQNAICCIEWPDRTQNKLADCIDIDVRIMMKEDAREMQMHARTQKGKEILLKLQGRT